MSLYCDVDGSVLKCFSVPFLFQGFHNDPTLLCIRKITELRTILIKCIPSFFHVTDSSNSTSNNNNNNNNNNNGLFTIIPRGGSSLVKTYYYYTTWFKITLWIIKESNKNNGKGNKVICAGNLYNKTLVGWILYYSNWILKCSNTYDYLK